MPTKKQFIKLECDVLKILSKEVWVKVLAGPDAGDKKKVKHAVIGDVVRAALAPKGVDIEEPADGGASDDAVSEVASREVAVAKVSVADMFAKIWRPH